MDNNDLGVRFVVDLSVSTSTRWGGRLTFDTSGKLFNP